MSEAFLLATAVFLCVGTALLIAIPRRAYLPWIAIASAAVALAIGFGHSSLALPGPPTDAPIEVERDGMTSSRSCRSCHPGNYSTWYDSYHRKMTQPATDESVLADFNDKDVQAYGRRFHMFRQDGEFWVEMDDPDWRRSTSVSKTPPRVKRKLLMTTGAHHLQLYWYNSGGGRTLRLLPIGHFVEDDRWFPVRSNFILPPPPSPTALPHNPPGEWNTGCVRCHATFAEPRVQSASHMDTVAVEMGIACEQCHGAGEEHVALNTNPARRYLRHLGSDPDPHIVNPVRLGKERGSEVCGRCHSVTGYTDRERASFEQTGLPYRPGDVLDESGIHVMPSDATDPSSFWSDGMVRTTGREYNGLVASPCYQRGEMTCMSCHKLHKATDDPRSTLEWAEDQLGAGMRGNQACLQCHENMANAVEAHTHHAPESTGSQCYNCHMPHTSLGLRKAVRSHQIDSPSAALDQATGRPNACNQCHADKSLGWAARYLSAWYGTPVPPLSDIERAVPATLVDLLSGDAAQRALASWTLGWEPARHASDTQRWATPFLGTMLDDPYDAVRYVALRSLRQIPEHENFQMNFVGPRAERRKKAQALIAGWAQMNQVRRESSDLGFLIDDPSGTINATIFEKLRKMRDDRPVSIRE